MKFASPVSGARARRGEAPVRATGRWQLTLELGRDRGTPTFLRIARALSDAIRDRRLAPDERLPGARTLAAELGVHRNTVIAAYDELVAQGWLRTERARGTFVAEGPPPPPADPAGRPRRRGRAAGLTLAPWPLSARDEEDPPRRPRRGAIALDGGTPDLREVPTTALARAYRRALRRAEHLGYGDARGHPRLRAALATMLATTRGVAVEADDVLVTRGSQGALDLVARALVRPGDHVAVEALGYGPTRAVLALAGAELVPVAVDAHGLDVDAVVRAHARRPLCAVALTPHHHYPTTVALAPWRREQLLTFAAAERVAVIEDDYDHEFHYRGRPLLPLKAADEAGVVVYIGTLSKLVAPGLRVGWVVAPPPLGERLLALRGLVDRQGDPALEAALAELFEDGEIQRHARRMRKLYGERRDALVGALEAELGGVVSVAPAHGGMALWVRVTDPDVAARLDAWLDRADARGVHVQRARGLVAAGPAPAAFRVGFARARPEELRLAVRRLRRALEDAAGTGRSLGAAD